MNFYDFFRKRAPICIYINIVQADSAAKCFIAKTRVIKITFR